MPIVALKTPKYSPPKESIVSWDNWKKGLNLLLRENEIDGAEMVLATNLILEGSGIPTKRWGSQNYFLAGPTGTINGLFPIKDASDNIQVVAVTDTGYATLKSGSSYTTITGASWPSGSIVEATELGGKLFLFSENREMVKYDFTSLTNYATITAPTNVVATNISGATGTSIWSWRVTAVGRSGGETLGSTPISLASLPNDLQQTEILISWSATSAASGDLLGYNVYRGFPGSERWIGGVDSRATNFIDVGTPSTDPTRTSPLADTTGGLKAKYVIRYQDRLIVAGVPGYPTRVWISGRWPDNERFDWYAGAGFIEIEPDSGQNITGLGIHQEKLVVFKETSVWQVNLDLVQYGIYLILNPTYKLLTASQGCSSHRSIVPVENDLMFSNEKGIYILRYEPQLLTVINANEISAKIRPFFESLSYDDLTTCAGAYIDKKYILSFPLSKKTIAFDRERLSFVGPWTTPFGIRQWAKYVDANGMERWLAADATDNYVTEFSSSLLSDKGTGISTIFKSKKEDFKDWSVFKTLNEAYLNFRNVFGDVSVNIYIEQRDGTTVSAKAFTISGSDTAGTSGIGTDKIGTVQLGLSNNVPTVNPGETPKKTFIYKTTRTFQVEVRTTGYTDNYELLAIKAIAIPQNRGNSPSSWLV